MKNSSFARTKTQGKMTTKRRKFTNKFKATVALAAIKEQKDFTQTILENADVKRSIVTRKLNLESIKVETEKPVSVLAQGIINGMARYIGVLEDGDLKKITAKSQDCVDLFIECGINAKDVSAKTLQIIIENKIDSPEGGKKAKNTTGVPEYDNASQTTRYYLGTKFSTFVAGFWERRVC